jgi:hypothetical protein
MSFVFFVVFTLLRCLGSGRHWALPSRRPTDRSSAVAVGISFLATQFAAGTHRAEIAHAEEIVGTRLSEGRRSKA